MTLSRRSLLRAVPFLVVAPAVVRFTSLMPVKAYPFENTAIDALERMALSLAPGSINYASTIGMLIPPNIAWFSLR